MRRSNRIHANKSDLFWCIAFFAANQVALLIALEWWWPTLRDPNYVVQMQRFEQRIHELDRPPLQVVSLGSSRVLNGLSGLHIEAELSRSLAQQSRVCNLAYPGGGPVLQRLLLPRLLERSTSPDLLLLEVVPHFLDARSCEANTIPPTNISFGEIEVMTRYGASGASLRRQWWDGEIVPWHGHRFKLVSLAQQRLLPAHLHKFWRRDTDISGWLPLQSPEFNAEVRRHKLQAMQIQSSDMLRRLRCDGQGAKALRDSLALAQRHGVRTAVLLMPESPIFRSWYSTNALAELHTFLTGLQRDFNAVIVDARNWVDEEGFMDGHHLLYEGAVAFSVRLGREALPALLYDKRLAHADVEGRLKH